ncbi:MAG: nucleoside hydrolase [Myxococcales bacterium]|nr:nucleoside hydrolase [Myxococcales bacterium]
MRLVYVAILVWFWLSSCVCEAHQGKKPTSRGTHLQGKSHTKMSRKKPMYRKKEQGGQSKQQRAARIPVWIDADPSVGLVGRDVDDGFAILQAFHSPELDIRGISVVFGNAPLEKAVSIMQVMLQKLRVKGLSVMVGARDHHALGRETPASRALAAALRKQKLTLLVLGPATNVATVLLREPSLAKQIKEIIAVAGRRPKQRFVTGHAKTPHRDFNFEKDPEAFRVLLRSGVRLVFAPWEISSRLWLRQADLDRLAASGELARWLVRPARRWLALWKRAFGVDGFNPFDTLAVGYLTSRHLLDCTPQKMQIQILTSDTPKKKFLGKKVAQKAYLLIGQKGKDARSVLYCARFYPSFREDLLRRITSKKCFSCSR